MEKKKIIIALFPTDIDISIYPEVGFICLFYPFIVQNEFLCKPVGFYTDIDILLCGFHIGNKRIKPM